MAFDPQTVWATAKGADILVDPSERLHWSRVKSPVIGSANSSVARKPKGSRQ